jgi:hypothetical protein
MKESKLNIILPHFFRMAITPINPSSISESGLSNIGFRHTIKDILAEEGYNKEDLPGNRVSRFSSDTKKGQIFCAHYSNEFINNQNDYGITYFGVKKEAIQKIEERILKTGYLKILD